MMAAIGSCVEDDVFDEESPSNETELSGKEWHRVKDARYKVVQYMYCLCTYVCVYAHMHMENMLFFVNIALDVN